MVIENNTASITKTINTRKTASAAKSSQADASDIVRVVKKAQSEKGSMVLTDKQKSKIDQTLGYDQPGFKQQGALAAYQKVAGQAQRDEIIHSMSVHFIV